MSENQMGDRAAALIEAISNSLFTAAEVAAEKIQMETLVAQMRMRMEAFSSVLEVIGVQKEALLAKVGLTGAQKILRDKQIEMLTAQETRILEKIGIEPDVAKGLIESVDDNPQRIPVKNGRHSQRSTS